MENINNKPNSNESAIILIVDDNKTNLQILGSTLQKFQYKVTAAMNGFQALELAEKINPDIILLDVMMPEMDGFEVCEKLKANEKTKEIPVVFLTAKVEKENIVQGFQLGGVDYITKPFNRDELLVRVNTHLSLKRSKDELRKMAADLSASNATKDKMFSIIAHDLRAPFTNLKLTLQLIEENAIDKNSPKFDELISLLTTSVDEAYALLENLLGWARSQSGKLNFIQENISMAKIIKNTVNVLNGLALNKEIVLSFQVSDDLKAYGDKNMITTVIRNLVNNAIKFTREKGNVTVSAETEDNCIKVKVSDTGVGMSEEDKNKLFKNDEFFTTSGTNSEKGTGLGLRLCKDFVEKHKGEIWVESQEGKGSDFIFTIPVVS